MLRRRDGFYAYQLAVVVDDADQGVSDVVRGFDLWDNTPRQLLLLQTLGLATPRYAHVPVVVDARGRKLSKADAAPATDATGAALALAKVLGLLQHRPPVELRAAPPAEQLSWALSTWNIMLLQGLKTVS